MNNRNKKNKTEMRTELKSRSVRQEPIENHLSVIDRQTDGPMSRIKDGRKEQRTDAMDRRTNLVNFYSRVIDEEKKTAKNSRKGPSHCPCDIRLFLCPEKLLVRMIV